MTDSTLFDPYETLGVEPDADETRIKSAYRKLAKDYHPDLNPGDPEFEKKFRIVTEAYEILSDNERRSAYDERRMAPEPEEAPPQPSVRPAPRPEFTRPRPARVRKPDPVDPWVLAARRRAAWEFASLALFIVALSLVFGSLLLGVLRALLGVDEFDHGSVFLRLGWSLLGFLFSAKLIMMVASLFLRERGYSQWSAGASVLALLFLVCNPFGLAVHIHSVASPFAGDEAIQKSDHTFPAFSLAPEALPDVAKEDRLSGPVPGLSVPVQALLRLGFAAATQSSVYTKQAYKTIFTLEAADHSETLAFSESLALAYDGSSAVGRADAQSFSFQDSPGYLTYDVLGDGTVDGHLHWSDHGQDLAIHATGLDAQAFSQQDLFQMLAAVRRVPEAAAEPVHVAASPHEAPPIVHADPCGPGTVCFDRRQYGRRGWFIRRGHGSDHPT